MASDTRREYGSGSISQRKDGTWTARFTIGVNENGKPKIKAFYGKTEREVKKKLNDYKKEFYKNGAAEIQKTTVEQFMSKWFSDNKRNSLKPKSFDRLEQTLKYQVFPKIGHIQLAALQSDDVQDMVNVLKEEGYAYSTVKKAYDAVNDCFRTGVIQRKIVFNPALGVTIPSKSTFGDIQIKYHSEDAVKAICEAARKVYSNGKPMYRLGDAIILDLNTGLRLAELAALKWSDVDFDKKLLYVSSTRVVVRDRSSDASKKYKTLEQSSTKSQSGTREIELNDTATDALHRLKEVTGNFSYVLATRDGSPLSLRYIDRMCRKIEVTAGLPEGQIYGMHALRHTFATTLFSNGVDIKTISTLLGHSDITITFNTYVHVIKKLKRDAVSSISKQTE